MNQKIGEVWAFVEQTVSQNTKNYKSSGKWKFKGLRGHGCGKKCIKMETAGGNGNLPEKIAPVELSEAFSFKSLNE